MDTLSVTWEHLNVEMENLWPWLTDVSELNRSAAMMALGVGLPGKVLMSW